MWNNHLLGKTPGGQAVVGQAQMAGHDQASLAAHAAATRARASRVLGAPVSPLPPAANPVPTAGPAMGAPMPFKHHIASALSAGGIPTSPQDVHAAIHVMTQDGHFTPEQGQGLMSHNGPLHGPQGLATMAKIGGMVAMAKQHPAAQ